MTGFIILCSLTFITGIIILYLAERAPDIDRVGFMRFIAILCALGSLGMIIIIVTNDFRTPITAIICLILTLWIGISIWAVSESFSITFISLSLLICTAVVFGDRPYKIHKTAEGFELRHPLTYWITRYVEAKGTDSISFTIRGKRGRVEYKNLSDVLNIEVNGLRDSAGRLHLPKICSYKDGYTDCYVEYYKADFHNVEVFHLCRPDGTSSRIDVTGNNVDSEGYSQPTYYNDEVIVTY